MIKQTNKQKGICRSETGWLSSARVDATLEMLNFSLVLLTSVWYGSAHFMCRKTNRKGWVEWTHDWRYWQELAVTAWLGVTRHVRGIPQHWK
jgi:hypothetical protein